MGFKEQPEYIPVPQVAADEDDEEDRPLVSPPSMVLMMEALMIANPPEVNENITVTVSRTIRVTPVQNR